MSLRLLLTELSLMTRTTDTKLHPIFLDRWSPRAFDESAMPLEDLATILEAARYAPSAMNHQPWRLLYSVRGDENWERFLGPLMPGNRAWAEKASALIYILSDKFVGERPSRSHSFDAGAAWAMLAVQATMLGYASHAMGGVDAQAAIAELGVPESFQFECAIALGRRGDPETLPEAMRAREAPSARKAREEIAYPGNFRA
jgi:nitroreductase